MNAQGENLITGKEIKGKKVNRNFIVDKIDHRVEWVKQKELATTSRRPTFQIYHLEIDPIKGTLIGGKGQLDSKGLNVNFNPTKQKHAFKNSSSKFRNEIAMSFNLVSDD